MILKGWVEEIRDIGKIKFLILHTINKTYQITCKKEITENFDELEKLTRQSAVIIIGEKPEKQIAKDYEEIIAKKVIIEALSDSNLPLDPSEKVKAELDTKLKWRFLDFRSKKTLAIIKIQNTFLQAFREFFINEGFIEIQPPIIISSASEGGAELFEVKYFDRKAYLAQSPQLYKQMAAISLEKVFCVVPIFRAEKHDTPYHLNEVRSLDIEVAFADEEDVRKYLERFFVYALEKILEKNKEELKILNVNLEIPTLPFPRVKYEDFVSEIGIEFGEDIKREHEKIFSKKYGDAAFLIDFAANLRPFYTYLKNEKISTGFDFIYKGLEIASGSRRINDANQLIKRIREFNLNEKDFEYYINVFKYGAPKHAGWAIGLERATMKICNLENIREATMWPRDRYILEP